jgi:hypothetical protein
MDRAMRNVIALFAAVAVLAFVPAHAEEPRVPDEPMTAGFWSQQLAPFAQKSVAPGQRWWEVVERDLGCGIVHDGCRTCTSGDCSPVPTACAPAEWKCVAPK